MIDVIVVVVKTACSLVALELCYNVLRILQRFFHAL